jgi:hypothetical protein
MPAAVLDITLQAFNTVRVAATAVAKRRFGNHTD